MLSFTQYMSVHHYSSILQSLTSPRTINILTVARPNTYRHNLRDVNKFHKQPHGGDRQNFECAEEKRKKKVVDENMEKLACLLAIVTKVVICVVLL